MFQGYYLLIMDSLRSVIDGFSVNGIKNMPENVRVFQISNAVISATMIRRVKLPTEMLAKIRNFAKVDDVSFVRVWSLGVG
jgi:hypothetical protein